MKQLFKFLKDKNILHSFQKNVAQYIGCNLKGEEITEIFCKKYLGDGNPESIQIAFDWDETPEGFSFWDKMNDIYTQKLIAEENKEDYILSLKLK